jgi:hypothetical protein
MEGQLFQLPLMKVARVELRHNNSFILFYNFEVMVSVFDLKYGEIYSIKGLVISKNSKFIYLGSDLKGSGRILSRGEYKEPSIFGFNLMYSNLEGKILDISKKGNFSRIYLNNKEKSFALEILNKKSL